MGPDSNYRGDLSELEALIDEYIDWYLLFVRIVFFAAQNNKARTEVPNSFVEWSKQAAHHKTVDSMAVGNLLLLHKEMVGASETVKALPRSNTNFLENENCEKFSLLFEEFLNKLKRMSRQDASARKEIDLITGLQTQNSFYKDAQREMERLTRQGKTFSLAIIKVDNLETMEKEVSSFDFESALKAVAKSIGKVVRSYDDYYQFDKGLFLAILRQTDPGGGLKAMQRLNEELLARSIAYKIKNTEHKVTTSSCIAEVSPGDDMRQLVGNLKMEVIENIKKPSTVCEYKELSALQKLLHDSAG